MGGWEVRRGEEEVEGVSMEILHSSEFDRVRGGVGIVRDPG